MSELTIKVSDYTRYPGPRYRQDGAFSGQEFREDVLVPALRNALAKHGTVSVILDNVAGYGSSFLEESFGGLLRNGFSIEDLSRHLRIVAETSRFQHHRLRAESYIQEQASRADVFIERRRDEHLKTPAAAG